MANVFLCVRMCKQRGEREMKNVKLKTVGDSHKSGYKLT